MILLYTLLAIGTDSPPSSASLSLLISILAVAAALITAAGGVAVEMVRRRAAADRQKRIDEANRARDHRIDKYGELSDELLQKWSDLKEESDGLKIKIAEKDVELQQLKDMISTRDDKIDALTREIAVWQYRLNQIDHKVNGGEGSPSDS